MVANIVNDCKWLETQEHQADAITVAVKEYLRERNDWVAKLVETPLQEIILRGAANEFDNAEVEEAEADE
jgi:hypothetical protein